MSKIPGNSPQPSCSSAGWCSIPSPQLTLAATTPRALDLLFALAAGRPLTRSLLMEYRAAMDGLAPSTVNVRLSAVRKLISEARKNGMLSVEDASNLTDTRMSGSREPAWETG